MRNLSVRNAARQALWTQGPPIRWEHIGYAGQLFARAAISKFLSTWVNGGADSCWLRPGRNGASFTAAMACSKEPNPQDWKTRNGSESRFGPERLN